MNILTWSRATLLGAAAVSLFAACGAITTSHQRAVGVIDWVFAPAAASAVAGADGVAADAMDPMSLPVLEAPETVRAGEAFTVTVRTYASACWKADGAEVVAAARSAVITPYDRTPPDDVSCPQEVVRLPRTLQLTFGEPGPAVIRVAGRRVVNGDVVREEAAEFEVSLVVQ